VLFLSSPTPVEWTFVYAPLAAMLITAFFVERSTGKIPNELVGALFLALLAARMTIGPGTCALYLLSVLITGVPLIVVFSKGVLGGGAVKLAMAASLAFLPLSAMCLVAGLLATGCFLRTIPTKITRVSGSGVILALCSVIVAASTLLGRLPVG